MQKSTKWLTAGSLLVALLGAAWYYDLLPPLSASAAANRYATEWIEKYSAKITRDDQQNVVGITISSEDFSDADCTALANFHELRRLTLTGTAITNNCLPELAKLPSLETLTLDGTAITDNGLGGLAESATLNELSLARCQLGPLSAQGLGSLTQLTSLNLMDAKFEAQSSEVFPNPSGLKRLYLGRTGLNAELLASLDDFTSLTTLNAAAIDFSSSPGRLLPVLPSLELLYLDQAQITTEQFAELVDTLSRESPNLTAVFLEDCPISDDSRDALLTLTKMPSMTKLRLTGCQISRVLFDQVRQSAPQISLAHGGSVEDD